MIDVKIPWFREIDNLDVLVIRELQTHFLLEDQFYSHEKCDFFCTMY